MKILITRPREDAVKLSAQITALGHTPIIMPLIEIVPRDISLPNHNFQAICVTSANGIAAIPENLDRSIPVLCVGPQSAKAAEAKGFQHIHFEGGDVDGLVALVHRTCKTENGKLLYLSGSVTSGDLAGKLSNTGFDVNRVVAYDALPTATTTLNDILPNVEAVVLYSKRTAQLWLSAIDACGAIEKAATITTLCLSEMVALTLPQSWNMRTAETPDEAAMLKLIERLT